MTALSTEATTHTGQQHHEEVDVWWGSYAGRAMVPSFVLCVVFTVLLYFTTRFWVPQRGWLQLTFTALATLLWLGQLVRFARRLFTYNYRMTSRFLYVDRCMRPLIAERIALHCIARVAIRTNWFQRRMGIGDLIVWADVPSKTPMVLLAVPAPQVIAEAIRTAAKKAKDEG